MAFDRLRAGALAAVIGLLSLAMTAGASGAGREQQVDFARPDAVMEIEGALAPYHGPTAGGCTNWYMLAALNDSDRAATRVLLAGQPPGTGLNIFPAPTRPEIAAVASSDDKVYVERVGAYGRRAFRVTLPPASLSELAVCTINTRQPPSILAWTEPALSQHNRNLAIFVAAVAGLIGAAAAIVGGLAAMSGHAAPRWAAITLFLVLFLRLAATGLFDASIVTPYGGPYGLTAMIACLAVACGALLADAVVPLDEIWPRYHRAFRLTVIGVVILGVLAFVGMPAAIDASDAVAVIGTAAIAAYLVHRGRMGSLAARVLAPSAAVFALVALVAAVTILGGFGENLVAGDAAGGFAAAGAVLLALAVAADEGLAGINLKRLPVRRHDNVPDRPESSTMPSYADAIIASRQGLFVLDFEQDLLTLSGEAASLIGNEDGDVVLHRDWIARIDPDDRQTYVKALAEYRRRPGIAFRIEFRVGGDDGDRWLELRATMSGDPDQASRCVGLIADVTARREADAPQEPRTSMDALTGLGNRLGLLEALERAGASFSQCLLAVLDIDRFKAVHGSLGDEGGDEVLIQLADRLRARFASRAELFRVGGDSFAVLSPEARSETHMDRELVESVNAAAFRVRGRKIFLQASVGSARGADAEDPLDLLKNAQLALIKAKRQGGNSAVAYTRETAVSVPDSVTLETELRVALDEKQFDVFYQPIVRLKDCALAGFEGVLRWKHPGRGMLSPDAFIPHAEQSGLILPMGRFALARATKDLAHWQRFFPLDPPLFVSVNVSRRQLGDPALERDLAQIISSGEIRRGSLKLEITESTVAAEPETIRRLEHLHMLGAGLSLDDFGTGVSNLSQLQDFPFETIKIDKSFLRRAEGEEDRSILPSVVALAHEMKRTVIVEGIETEQDLVWLQQLGCEFGQGFRFGAPMSADEALNYIAMHFDSGAAVLDGVPRKTNG